MFASKYYVGTVQKKSDGRWPMEPTSEIVSLPNSEKFTKLAADFLNRAMFASKNYVGAVQKCANIVEFDKCCTTHIY